MKRLARYIAYAVAGLALLLVGAVLVLPQLLDRPQLAAEIQAKLSQAVQGEVRWQDFSMRILPAPHGALRGLRVETASATLTADEVTVALRLWPLFRGRAEIASLELSRPALSMTIVPDASVPQEAQLAPAQDTLATYRAILSGVVSALQDFAPDTMVAIQDAGAKVAIEGAPPLELSKLALRGRTSGESVELEASASSPYWSAMKLAGRIRYADLSSTAELRLTRVQGKAWLDWLLKPAGVGVDLPEVDLDIRFRGDATKALEADLSGNAKTLAVTHGGQTFSAAPLVLQAKLVADASDVTARVAKLAAGATSLGAGTVRYRPKDDEVSGEFAFHLDLPQLLGYARQLAPEPLERVDSLAGSLRGTAKASLKGGGWHVGIAVAQSDAALQVKSVPGPIRLTRVALQADPRGAQVENAALSLPAGDVQIGSLRYAFKDGALAVDAKFDLDVAQTVALARGLSPEGSLDIVEAASGRLGGTAKATVSGAGWTAGLDIAKSDAQTKLKPLPAPLALEGAAIRATPKAVTIERARVKLLDASAQASATISDFSAGPRVRAAVSQATLGPALLDWVWQTAGIPKSVELKAPVAVSLSQFVWAPKAPIEVRADAHFGSGAAIGVDVAWSPESLHVRRASVKDARSDMIVSVRTQGSIIDGSYSGTLDSRTIGAMLKSAAAPPGAVAGELRFVFDRAEPQRTTVQGRLKGERVDLSWLAGAPAAIEQLELTADGDTLRVAEATVDWAGQRATLRGEVARTASGPVVNAQVDSPGIVVDALMPKSASKPPGDAKPAQPWPLPVTGTVALRTKLLQYDHYRVEPLSATLKLERERAFLDVNEALLCGLAVPMTVEAKPDGYAARALILAQKQKIEDAVQCLAGEKVVITGPMDLRVDVRTQGQVAELVPNLTGTVSADLRNGTVTRFALLGNILSMQNVAALATEGGPKLGADSFPFRQLSAKGHFDKGRFYIDEGVFHSNAIGLGANGWISLTDFQTNLTVLVAPLALVDEAVRKLPLLGYVVGGTFTSLPVAVNGDIRDPRVIPLGPRAITSEMMGLLTRTLTLPGKVVPGDK